MHLLNPWCHIFDRDSVILSASYRSRAKLPMKFGPNSLQRSNNGFRYKSVFEWKCILHTFHSSKSTCCVVSNPASSNHNCHVFPYSNGNNNQLSQCIPRSMFEHPQNLIISKRCNTNIFTLYNSGGNPPWTLWDITRSPASSNSCNHFALDLIRKSKTID
jgi:hypothetical protein